MRRLISLHGQDIQHTVVRHGVRHGHEAAAVVPAVADAQDGGLPLLPVQAFGTDGQGTAEAPEDDLLRQG